AEAGRIAVIMSKVAREAFGPPVEVKEPDAGRHPESLSPIIEKRAAVEHGRPGAKRVLDDAPRPAVILDQPDVRRRGQHPEIAGSVLVKVDGGEALDRPGRASDLSGLRVQMKQAKW